MSASSCFGPFIYLFIYLFNCLSEYNILLQLYSLQLAYSSSPLTWQRIEMSITHTVHVACHHQPYFIQGESTEHEALIQQCPEVLKLKKKKRFNLMYHLHHSIPWYFVTDVTKACLSLLCSCLHIPLPLFLVSQTQAMKHTSHQVV